MLTRFSNNFYRLEQPSDIELVKKDMEERESIHVIYNGEQVYPMYVLCNNEYMGRDYLDYLAVNIVPEELIKHIKDNQ